MAERISATRKLVRVLVGVTASVALLVGVAVGVATIQLVRFRNVGTLPGEIGTGPQGAPVDRGECVTRACNYLLLGSDSRAGLTPEEQARFGTDASIGGTHRADTVMLVHTDPRLQKAIVVSFPRDLWVTIPGRGRDRINTAFEGGLAGGGPHRMAQTVANLTRLQIDHFLYVDLAGFQHIVDTLGGVRMCVPGYQVNTPGWLPATLPDGEPTQIYYDEVGHIADANAGLLIEPGCQRLDGDQALAYVRARHLPCDTIPDFARIGRQQQFLRAVINQLLQPEMVVRAPSLVRPVLSALRRDRELRTSDLVYLVGQLRGLSTGAVDFRTVPGTAATIDSKSVLRLDSSAHEIFDAIRQGRPLGRAGTQLVNTPPSEANITVAVVDGATGDAAAQVEAVLTDAGFDVGPGIWTPQQASLDVTRAAIVHRASASDRAQVVAAYFPDLPVIESSALRGAHVAVVLDTSYRFVPPSGGSPTAESDPCPGVG
jgi:anionic cell wall polymer biosynthesis LytR-Cps2A-Psr (LCP) family protein